ncbi:MAG: 30S ribosomal protein S16 [Leptospiraceae bacterium]|nr:30S ribosomal protein S16 [Leptospiraceae bacterium]
MVKIRLHRFGKKKKPIYRIVVVDSRKRRDGKYIESVGFYNPSANEKEILYKVQKERAEYWLNQGAWPTETVLAIFKKAGVVIPNFVLKKEEQKYQARLKSKANQNEKNQS